MITRWEFELYLGLTISLIVGLMWASHQYGSRSILIDVGLVALFGELHRCLFTVLLFDLIANHYRKADIRRFLRRVSHLYFLVHFGMLSHSP
jgi:hypothetical protein